MDRLSKVSLVGCCIQLGADCDSIDFRRSLSRFCRSTQSYRSTVWREDASVDARRQRFQPKPSSPGGVDSLGGRRASLNSEARTSSCRCKTCSGPTFGCPIRGDVLRCVGSGGRRCMEASLPGRTFSIVPLSDKLYPFVLEFQGQLVHDFQACRQSDTLDAVNSRPSVSRGRLFRLLPICAY